MVTYCYKIINITAIGRNEKVLLDTVNFEIKEGEKLGLTGPSGSGKTTIFKIIMDILDPSCKIKSGEIILNGISLLKLSSKKRRELCGVIIGFIPQNPMTSFDDNYSIKDTMMETFKLRLNLTDKQAVELMHESLKKVNLKDTDRILKLFPNELSGGMLQRISIAMLIAMNPKYVLADEPTAFLDVENKEMIVDLLNNYLKDTSIIFASHDIESIKKLCDRVLVVEEGRIKNCISKEEFLEKPKTKWERLLIKNSIKGGGDTWEWKELRQKMFVKPI